MSTTTTTATEERALKLLGDGIEPSVVASAVGVSLSRISQLLSVPEFQSAVLQRKYESLAANTERDKKADRIEDLCLEKLEASLGMIFDPMKVLAVYTKINMAKRRGVAPTEVQNPQQPTVSINIPTLILNQYTTINNAHNQVVQISDDGNKEPSENHQSLVTIQSSGLDALRRKHGNLIQSSGTSAPQITQGGVSESAI